MATGGAPEQQEDSFQAFLLGRNPAFKPQCNITKDDYKKCFKLLRKLHNMINELRNCMLANDPREKELVHALPNDADDLYLHLTREGRASRHLSTARRRTFGSVAFTIWNEAKKLFYDSEQIRLSRTSALAVLKKVQDHVEYLAENLPTEDDGTAPSPSSPVDSFSGHNIAQDSPSDTTDSGTPTSSRSWTRVRNSFRRLKKKDSSSDSDSIWDFELPDLPFARRLSTFQTQSESRAAADRLAESASQESRAAANMTASMSELHQRLSGTVLNAPSGEALSREISEESSIAATPGSTIDLDGMRTERRRQRMQHPGIQPRSRDRGGVSTPTSSRPAPAGDRIDRPGPPDNTQSLSRSGSDGAHSLSPANASTPRRNIPQTYRPPVYDAISPHLPNYFDLEDARPPSYSPGIGSRHPRSRSTPPPRLRMQPSASPGTASPLGGRNNISPEGSRVRLVSGIYPPGRIGDMGTFVSGTLDGRVLVRLDDHVQTIIVSSEHIQLSPRLPNYFDLEDSPGIGSRHPRSRSTPPPRLRMQHSASPGSASPLGGRNNISPEGSRVKLVSDIYPPGRIGDVGTFVSGTLDGRVLVRLDDHVQTIIVCSEHIKFLG